MRNRKEKELFSKKLSDMLYDEISEKEIDIDYKLLNKYIKKGLKLEWETNNRPGEDLLLYMKKFPFVYVGLNEGDSIDTVYGILPSNYSKKQLREWFSYTIKLLGLGADELKFNAKTGEFRFWWD